MPRVPSVPVMTNGEPVPTSETIPGAQAPGALKYPPGDVVARLEADLRRAMSGEVRFDSGTRALYAVDGSNYRQAPIGVVIPRHADDVEAAMAVCHRLGVPVLSRGGGTSLAGQCCNAAVVFDFSKYMNGLVGIDAPNMTARVQPGLILDHLREATTRQGLTFGPDPATHDHCTLGGMIGNNSCGVHAIMAGRTSDCVDAMDILTYDGLRMHVGPTPDDELDAIIRAGGRRGDIYRRLRDLRNRYANLIRTRFPDIPRRVSGYNLVDLLPENGFNVAKALTGSEGTLVTILEAKVRLVKNPPKRTVLVLGYPDIYKAAEAVPFLMGHGPIGLEGIDDRLYELARQRHLHPEGLKALPKGHDWLIVEFGGETQEDADDKARKLMADLKGQGGAPYMKIADKESEMHAIWSVRESGLGATAFPTGRGDTWEGWEDSAVDPKRLGDYLRAFRRLLDKYGYEGALYGHFGQGCVHTRIDFDLLTADGIKHYRAFVDEAADLVVAMGGSLSGEHGDGQSRGELLYKMFGNELVQAFREFKAIWDPQGKMNPGKIVDAYPVTSNLKLGADYDPPEVKTHFDYGPEGGSFPHAALRCVGIGECRRTEGGTMCPSFMVTREEMHTTRGRAHALFEMLQGDIITKGWRDHAVKEALDLCLACKGCKADCPVNVDMATYKAEFLSHFYKGRLRPRAAYAMGLINRWARIGSAMPKTANAAARWRPTAWLLKAGAGIAQERAIPAFAPQTFKAWFKERKPVNETGKPVILWADTFTNHFHPEIGQAAVAVLERAGCRVIVPQGHLCCGRPLYDFGMLDRAKAYLERVLTALAPEIEKGVPLVGLEPSCLAVFRDEIKRLFPHDCEALRLNKQAYTLAEFLLKEAGDDFAWPRLERHAIVQGHCHHKSVMGFSAETQAMAKMGLDAQVLNAGCCGMAGSFGFEADKYHVSMACGERALLPAVRAADQDCILMADGFSCRTQIEQATGRHAWHLAQVIAQAMEGRAAPHA